MLPIRSLTMMPMNHDLNDTLIFVKVVESGGFIHAARALGVPKTTVSRKVLALEQRLGARLLKRTTRRIGLTEAGAAYYERCRGIVGALADAEAVVSELHAAPRGWLRINLPYSMAQDSIGHMLDGFMTRHPDVRVELVASDEPLDLVASDIDLALRIGALPDSTQSARQLCRSGSHVYASVDYIRRHGAPAMPDELRQHRALALTTQRQGSRFGWHLRPADAKGLNGFRDYAVDAVLVSSAAETLGAPLIAGAGIAMLPDGYVDDPIAEGRVQRVLRDWAGPEIEFNVVFPPGRTPPPKARAFVDYLVEKLRDNPCVQVSERACMPKIDDEVRVLVPERSFAAY
jgi:DNA-binding transcriptional LysR family regulator